MEHQSLGGAPPEQDGHFVQQFLLRHQEAIFDGTLDRVAECTNSARDDRDLVHRVAARNRAGDQRMPHFMIGRDLALVWVEQPVPLLETGHDALDGVVEIFHADDLGIMSRGQECGLIHQVGEVGTREARRERRDRFGKHVRCQTHPTQMHLQDLDPRLFVGSVDQDLAVEAASPEQRRVEDLWAVRGREQNDALTRIEAVELGEKLIEGLLFLVVAPAHGTDAAGTAQGV